MTLTEKKCKRCGGLFPLEQFHRDCQSKDGHWWACKPCARLIHIACHSKRRDKMREGHRVWRDKNRATRNAYRRALHAKLMTTSPQYKWEYKIRRKVHLSIRGIRKSAPTEQLIGCTFIELRRYIEIQWEPWMNWGNYGSGPGTWQIDHKTPVAVFDLTDPDQQKLCWHYTNLRPLSWEKNVAKGKKLIV